MEADDILKQLGRCGRYQILVHLLMSLVCLRGVWQLFAPIYLGADPGHHCAVPDNTSLADVIPHVIKDGSSVPRKCEMYANGSRSNQTVPCKHGFRYGDGFDKTILTEWDLVCDKAHFPDIASSVFMSGMLIGSICITPLADRFGRRKVLLAALWIQGGVGIATAFSDSFMLFAALRFVMGVLNQTIGLVSCTILPEAFPSSNRTSPYIAMFLFWSGGVMSLALLGYFIRNWRYLQIAITLPNFLTISYYWFLPESIPWLISTKRNVEAEIVISKAAKLNNVILREEGSAPILSGRNENQKEADSTTARLETPRSTEEEGSVCEESVSLQTKQETEVSGSLSIWHPKESSKTTVDFEPCLPVQDLYQKPERRPADAEIQTAGNTIVRRTVEMRVPETPFKSANKKYGVCDLFRTPKMRLYSCLVFFLWFANSLGYFGMTFLVTTLHGDPFLNLFFSGLVEIPAYLISMFTLEWVGRRRPVFLFMVISGVSSIVAICVPQQTEAGADLEWLRTGLAMISKCCITGSYVTIYLLCVEIFPTVLRNMGTGIAAAFETVGAMAAPFIASSAKETPKLPLIVFSVLTIIGGGLCLILPETHRKPLPETVEEVECWDKRMGAKEARPPR